MDSHPKRRPLPSDPSPPFRSAAARSRPTARSIADSGGAPWAKWVTSSFANPIVIPDFSEPQPDLALLTPRGDSYRDALPLPAEVKLVVEVADSTLRWDRDVKIALYGRHGIAEAWLVELPRRVVTVYRDPGPQRYRLSMEITQGSVSPQCLPELQIGIDEIFGPG